jgi:predicted nucleic acid-binding protein
MAVVKEVSGQGSFRIGSDVFARHDWIRQVPVSAPSSPLLAACLGRGELEVIQLGFSRNDALLLLDDYRARRAAEAWNLPATGSVGVLIRAKEHGLIDAVLPLLTTMRSAGYFISDAVVQAARLHAHE